MLQHPDVVAARPILTPIATAVKPQAENCIKMSSKGIAADSTAPTIISAAAFDSETGLSVSRRLHLCNGTGDQDPKKWPAQQLPHALISKKEISTSHTIEFERLR